MTGTIWLGKSEPDDFEPDRETPAEAYCLVCGRDCSRAEANHCRACQLDDDALGEERE